MSDLFPVVEETTRSLLCKWCRVCGSRKRLDLFPKKKKMRDGRASICLECNRKKLSDYYHTPAGKEAQLNSNRRNKHQISRSRFNAVKHSVKGRKKGCKKWDLTFEEWSSLVCLPCEYCGGELPNYGGGLDRIDNSKGYEAGNVLPSCTACNIARSDHFTVSEMRKHIGPAIRKIRLLRMIMKMNTAPAQGT